MKILFIKQSSLGDLIHCFPAIHDLKKAKPNIQIDWLVEKNFVNVPKWHPCINKSIPISIREWRKNFFKSRKVIKEYFRHLKDQNYDLIIDAQALYKSAIVGKMIGSKMIGFSRKSIRTEKGSSIFYQQSVNVQLKQHAIDRIRELLACYFNYKIPVKVDFQINLPTKEVGFLKNEKKSIVAIHGTTWDSKHLPETHWQELLRIAKQNHYQLVFPWLNEKELKRVHRIVKFLPEAAIIAPKLTIDELANVINQSAGVIAVDSGFAHIAAALGKPTVTLYGSTNRELTAALGPNSSNLQTSLHCSPCMLQQCKYLKDKQIEPPCYQTIKAEIIWEELFKKMSQ